MLMLQSNVQAPLSMTRYVNQWWFKRLPRVPGRTNGVANNGWRYVIDVNDPELDAA